MKYVVLKNNLEWNMNYSDVINFETIEDRNAYIETLHDGWEQDLEDCVETASFERTSRGTEITVRWSSEYQGKNTIVIKEGDKIVFYFITSVNIHSNNNLVTFTLENIVFLNVINVWSRLNGMKLVRGHLPFNLYKNKEFDTGDYKILGKNAVERKSSIMGETPFIYVFEKTTENEKNIQKMEYVWDTDTNKLQMPYGVKIAPLYPINLNEVTNSQNIVNDDFEINGSSHEIVVDVPQDATINIKGSLLDYNRAVFVPLWGSVPFYDCEIKMADIWDKSEYYVFIGGYNVPDKGSGRWDDYFERTGENSIKASIGLESGIAANGTVEGSIVVIRYDSVSNIMTFREINRTEYLAKRAEQDLPKLYRNTGFISDQEGDWDESGKSESQETFRKKNIEGLDTDRNQIWVTSIDQLGGSVVYWNANELVDYIQDSERNANIINWKISNYNPLLLAEGYDKIEGYESIYNVTWDGSIAQLIQINGPRSKEVNTYEVDMKLGDWNTSFNLLKGLNTKKILIENMKYFEIDLQNINDDGIVGFTHWTIPSPNEWEERIEWSTGNNIYTETNIWSNDKEGFTPTNDLSLYKSNSPIQSKMSLLSPLANPLNYIQKGRSGAVVAQMFGEFVNRQDMKRKPEEITGSGSIYPDTLFNEFGSRFIEMNILPQGTEYIEAITDMYRNGLQVDTGFIVNNIDTIKRPRFNYIMSDNIDDIIFDLDIEIKDVIIQAFRNGIRIWHSAEGFRTYADVLDDNNDLFNN